MEVFPAFVPLTGAVVALAGEGEGLEAKARLLAGSPSSLIRIEGEAAFDTHAWSGVRLAFVAHPDPDYRRRAAQAARAAGALVNVVDDPAQSDFHTPAIVDRGSVVIGLGTGGKAPMLAAALRARLEAALPEGLAATADLIGGMQAEIRAAAPDQARRRALLRAVLEGEAPALAASGDREGARAALRAALAGKPPTGRVYFLDASGEADLVSLRALRVLSAADAVSAEAGVNPAILGLGRRDAHRLAADADLAPLAAQGWQVVRLTDGAPDAAEIVALDHAGVETVVLRTAGA